MTKVRQTSVNRTTPISYDADEKYPTMTELAEKLGLFEKNIKGITHVENINEFMSRPCSR
jgi:hypothetical protein